MNEKVTQMVDLLFRDVQSSEEVQALHDEVLNNCQDRFAARASSRWPRTGGGSPGSCHGKPEGYGGRAEGLSPEGSG